MKNTHSFLQLLLRLLRTFIVRRPFLKQIAMQVLQASPRLSSLVAKFVGDGPDAPSVVRIGCFKDLKSVRIMNAADSVTDYSSNPIFLEFPENVR